MTSPAPLAHISVIIVNYGTADLTIAAVDSVLARSHGGRMVDVHVVDNASPDDSVTILRTAHEKKAWSGRVVLHLETQNHGFGRGNNIVLEQLEKQSEQPDAVFLLNPDAFLKNEAIDVLAATLESDSRAGFAGAGIAKPDGAGVTAAFRFPSVISAFSSTLNFGPVTRRLARWTVALPPDEPAGIVDWVSGAAVLIRMKALQQTKYFDPDFFLYYEEVELMWRGAACGWHSLYVPDAQVVHVEGESTGVKSGRTIAARVPNYHYASWQYYFLKTHGRPMALLAAAGSLIGSSCNRVISGLRRRPSSVPAFFFRDFWCYAVLPLLYKSSTKPPS